MANRSSASGKPAGVNISALDANRAGASPTIIAIPAGTYADDDSVVSSNVTYDGEPSTTSDGDNDSGGDPEVAILTRAAATDVENARAANGSTLLPRNVRAYGSEEQELNGKGGILPRNRREWCIVLLAVVLILAVALGTGLGLGLALGGGDNNSNTNTSNERNIDDAEAKPQNDDLDDEDSYPPTMSPDSDDTDTSQGGNLSEGRLPQQPDDLDLEDLASAVTWHAINQEISAVTSFSDLASGDNDINGSDTLSAQQRARDFLVLRDFLPTAINDEDDEQQSASGGGDDDPLAIPAETKKRPYLETSDPAYRVAQRFSAVVLYYASGGDGWETNKLWLEPGVHECDFIGVTCDELPIPAITLKEALELPDGGKIPRLDDGTVRYKIERMITAIDLPENNLGGYLPQEIMALPYLQRLALWSNSIGGELPTQLGVLTKLTSLYLDDNLLEGKIPSEVGLLIKLTDLSLAFNKDIGGRIPEEIGNLSKLERLRLSNMSLRGPIPSSFGQLTNLVGLYLQNNSLRGKLPEELENLINLESLLLSDNGFTGDVPESWRNLGNLKRLEIQSNKLRFDLDERELCSLRDDITEGGLLEALVADCQGDEPKVSCTCCTDCLP